MAKGRGGCEGGHVFAGAEAGAEQTAREEKHTHIVLCVVVGDFIILQTSRTETQTVFILSVAVAH